jgi:hypothetical protein
LIRFRFGSGAAKVRAATPSLFPEHSLALPPKTDQAFLREVDEELRRDKLAGFWTNWGIWVGVAVVAALAALAGFRG